MFAAKFIAFTAPKTVDLICLTVYKTTINNDTYEAEIENQKKWHQVTYITGRWAKNFLGA